MKFRKLPAVAALILSSLPAFAAEGHHTRERGGDTAAPVCNNDYARSEKQFRDSMLNAIESLDLQPIDGTVSAQSLKNGLRGAVVTSHFIYSTATEQELRAEMKSMIVWAEVAALLRHYMNSEPDWRETTTREQREEILRKVKQAGKQAKAWVSELTISDWIEASAGSCR